MMKDSHSIRPLYSTGPCRNVGCVGFFDKTIDGVVTRPLLTMEKLLEYLVISVDQFLDQWGRKSH
jgi:hypothetical protein